MKNEKIKLHFGYLLDENLITEISNIGIYKTFKKDDIIIDINQELNYIPLLLDGNIKVLREDKNGNELLIYFLESGDTCTMTLDCCVNNSKSKIRAISETDSSLIMIPIEKMNEWFHSNESWRNFILRSYRVRLSEMFEAIDSLAFMKLDDRLFKYLSDKVKLTGDTLLNITHQQISEDMNTSRVVISRLLKQLENENKIKLSRNKIEVLNF